MISAPGPSSLRDTWFGRRLPADALARLGPLVHVKSYGAGVEVLREGEPTRALGILARGRVALRLRVPERGPTTVLTVEEGDIIGWSALVSPHRATTTVVTLIPTDILYLDGAALRAELDADPLLAVAVYRTVLEALAHRLTGTRMQLLDLFAQHGDDWW